MRMRRKKNLEERLAACSENLFIVDKEDRDFNTALTFKDYIDINGYFGNDNPVMLEIGCGKGQFACEIASKNPDINFIAVEKSANVIVAACEKALDMGLKNLLFIKCSAEYLNSYLPDNSVSRIFLNFSCPFPKTKYACHRLTAQNFLIIYKRLMKSGAEIHVKTDNRGLFEFSIEQMSDFGLTLKNVSLDLHNSDFEGNIVTEYESKVVTLGGAALLRGWRY
ncbi:MAG: tRNA (guanosine(46)-N7)-methyltransferase TrmB [Clostridiales bacterium]|nr:tRNA (guanosine(46)-N7)-methyltransferase TrmB [Candidatus Equinaster intestinalis]